MYVLINISQIKKKGVDRKYIEYDKAKDPYYVEYNLLTMILKSYISINKTDYANDTSPNCHLLVNGIVPPLQVDLCTDHHDNLTFIDHESQSTNKRAGPVEKFGSGMCVVMCTM